MVVKRFNDASALRFVLIVLPLIIVAGIFTIQRNLVWQDNLTLFEDTVRKSPDFVSIKNELAIALRAHGRDAEAYQIFLSNSVGAFHPGTLNRIRVYCKQGDYDTAYKLLKKRPDIFNDASALELLYQINDMRLTLASSETLKTEIYRERLASMEALHKITKNPFYYYRMGHELMRLGNKTADKEFDTKAWQQSSPDAFYHEAAKKMVDQM